MSQSPKSNSFTLAWADIDPSLLHGDARELGSPAFRRAVGAFLSQQFGVVGKATAVFNDAARTVEVTWMEGGAPAALHTAVQGLLESRDFARAIPLLKSLTQQRPDDPAPLLNLGMVYSDLGRLDEALVSLRDSLRLRPDHVPTMVALAVVQARAGEIDDAAFILLRASVQDPANALVRQNLGGVLLKKGDLDAATTHLRECLKLDPGNVQAKLGLAQALESQGDTSEADGLYQDVLAAAGSSPLADIAKEGRTRIAHSTLRRAGEERPDVVMYFLGAMERFEEMESRDIQALGQEIAVLGMKGLDINDPARKYRLRSLPGEFSGLHLVSLMYAAFQEIAPGTDVGIDLEGEYAAARSLFEERRQGG